MEAGRRIVVQRERVPSIGLKVNGRIDRAREERWDELWAPDAIAVAAAGRVVVLAGDELSRGVDCQRFAGDHHHHNHHHHGPPTKTPKVECGETGGEKSPIIPEAAP